MPPLFPSRSSHQRRLPVLRFVVGRSSTRAPTRTTSGVHPSGSQTCRGVCFGHNRGGGLRRAYGRWHRRRFAGGRAHVREQHVHRRPTGRPPHRSASHTAPANNTASPESVSYLCDAHADGAHLRHYDGRLGSTRVRRAGTDGMDYQLSSYGGWEQRWGGEQLGRLGNDGWQREQLTTLGNDGWERKQLGTPGNVGWERKQRGRLGNHGWQRKHRCYRSRVPGRGGRRAVGVE